MKQTETQFKRVFTPKDDLHFVPDIKKTNTSCADKAARSGAGTFDKNNTGKGW